VADGDDVDRIAHAGAQVSPQGVAVDVDGANEDRAVLADEWQHVAAGGHDEAVVVGPLDAPVEQTGEAVMPDAVAVVKPVAAARQEEAAGAVWSIVLNVVPRISHRHSRVPS